MKANLTYAFRGPGGLIASRTRGARQVKVSYACSARAMPYLEYYPRHVGPVRRILLSALPFRIGRAMTSQFVISSYEVSKEHAEIFQSADQFRIRDLGSTNGTFINGYRITEAPLADDDIFHVAHEEFRFIAATHSQETDETETNNTEPVKAKTPLSVARSTEHLEELVRKQWVRILFQPIIDLETAKPLGYEALARGMHSDLSASPSDLLTLAERCGMVTTLSQLFRRVAVDESAQLPPSDYLFLNLHPTELSGEQFLEDLRALRAAAPPERQLVLEIHENAAYDFATLRRLRQDVKELGIQIAYDDFGAGQARFLELAELPPDFVKLDMRLIRNIDQVEPRRNLIRALARVSVELGIRVIAEGVETPEEAEVCRELGCQFGQGYFFGLPKAACLHKSKDRTHTLN